MQLSERLWLPCVEGVYGSDVYFYLKYAMLETCLVFLIRVVAKA
jgi:hypothetical protein